MFQFRIMLQNIKKESLARNEYLSKITNAIICLVLVAHSISDSDDIEAIFNGLPDDYDTFIISKNSRFDGSTIEEIDLFDTRSKNRKAFQRA